MKLYGGIDLHSNNSVVALLDEEEQLVYRKRLRQERPRGQVLVRQAKLGVSCRVQVPVGRGVGSDSS